MSLCLLDSSYGDCSVNTNPCCARKERVEAGKRSPTGHREKAAKRENLLMKCKPAETFTAN